MKNFFLVFLVLSSFFGFTSIAAAITFTGTAVGSWDNVSAPPPGSPVAIANNDDNGVAKIEWGTGNPPSSFTFDGAGSDPGDPEWSVNDELPFLIGDFWYENGVITNWNQFGDVDLNILLSITTPTNVSDTFTYNFEIETTANTTGNPVLDADIVTIANSFSPVLFTYDSIDYTLELLGFSNDGINYTDSFNSPEGANAHTGIYAQITSEIPNPVPEPATMLLLGAGLIGLAGFGRKKFKKIS